MFKEKKDEKIQQFVFKTFTQFWGRVTSFTHLRIYQTSSGKLQD